jgi:hypothetical protein
MSPLLVVKGVGAQTALTAPEEPELEDELATVVAPEEDDELEDEDELEEAVVEATPELAVVEATPELLELAWVVDPVLVLLELVAVADDPVELEPWLPVLPELPPLLPEQAVEAASRVREATSASRFMQILGARQGPTRL